MKTSLLLFLTKLPLLKHKPLKPNLIVKLPKVKCSVGLSRCPHLVFGYQSIKPLSVLARTFEQPVLVVGQFQDILKCCPSMASEKHSSPVYFDVQCSLALFRHAEVVAPHLPVLVGPSWVDPEELQRFTLPPEIQRFLVGRS